MSQKHLRMSFGISGLLGLLALVLSTSSCAQTEASGSSAQPDEVMQSIRNYGRGHQAILSTVNLAKPDQLDMPYRDHIRSVRSIPYLAVCLVRWRRRRFRDFTNRVVDQLREAVGDLTQGDLRFVA